MARIGFIGAGKMGVGVALNLLKHGHDVTAHKHRDTVRPAELAAAGATVSTTTERCVARQELVFVCLASMAAWDDVMEQVLAKAEPASLVVDMTTGQPDRTVKLQRDLASRGVALVDAPILKGPPAARAATIQVLVGGLAPDVARAMAVLEQVSEAQHATGGPGTGHALKLINNAVTLTNSAIVYETFALAARLGIDLALAHRVMDASAASSKRLNAIAPALIGGEHPASFDVATALKDLDLYCEMARTSGGMTLSGSGARSIYRLGAMIGLCDLPVTQLGELLFDLMSGRLDGVGQPGTIHSSYLKGDPDHA